MLLKLHALPNLPNVTRQRDWGRVGAYELDLVNLWLAHPAADPRLGLRTFAAHMDEGALYLLTHEVMPDLVRRWERYAGRSAPGLPPPKPGGGSRRR